MNILLIVSFFWVSSEILLSRMMRAKDSNDDKSSLKILWSTICLSITLGNILRIPDFTLPMKFATFNYNMGISLICIGLIVRWIAILTLKKSFTVNVSVAEDQQIMQSGIYKFIRHPSYLGTLLSVCGLAISYNNCLTFLIIFIPIFFAFNYRIRIEEELLSNVFGAQYVYYIKKSWKLIPWVF